MSNQIHTATIQIGNEQPLALKGVYLFVLQKIHKLIPLNQKSIVVQICINEKTSYDFKATSMRVRTMIGDVMKLNKNN